TPGVAGSSPVRSATYYETQSQDWVFCYLELIESQILITAYRLFHCSSSKMFNHPKLSNSSYCSFCVYPTSVLYPLYRRDYPLEFINKSSVSA
ncbi:hypothetical protein D6V22_18095, partial [Vibrio cholerae]